MRALLLALALGVRWTAVEKVTLPGEADSNSPVVWWNGRLVAFTSDGVTRRSEGASLETLAGREEVVWDGPTRSRWIESAWVDADGAIYAWYHSEQTDVCENKLSVPVIGALVSHDGGHTFTDLGVVLASGVAPECGSLNGFFAGGHGDFSVIPDREGKYFYFFFGNYGGPVAEQGVAMARMRFEDRGEPVGRVWKHHAGSWSEPGMGGHMTPMFAAERGWQAEDTSAFWGPAVHWNTYLERFVLVMNHSCCHSLWPQEGIYLSMGSDLADPVSWSAPVAIARGGVFAEWYPSVIGTGPGQTDALAGRTARFFLRGVSEFELEFDANLAGNEVHTIAGHTVYVRSITRRR